MTACAIFPVASVGAAGAVPPIRGGKCHLWCLAPGQRIYGRWRALVRRARRLAVGPAAGIRYYPLSRLLEKGRCPGQSLSNMSDSLSQSNMSDLMVLTIQTCAFRRCHDSVQKFCHRSACASLRGIGHRHSKSGPSCTVLPFFWLTLGINSHV